MEEGRREGQSKSRVGDLATLPPFLYLSFFLPYLERRGRAGTRCAFFSFFFFSFFSPFLFFLPASDR